jgi:hypothetical protein
MAGNELRLMLLRGSFVLDDRFLHFSRVSCVAAEVLLIDHRLAGRNNPWQLLSGKKPHRNFFGNFACQGGKLVHCACKFSTFNRSEGVGDPIRSDDGNLLQLPRALNGFYDTKGHRVIVAVKTNQIGIALQDSTIPYQEQAVNEAVPMMVT